MKLQGLVKIEKRKRDKVAKEKPRLFDEYKDKQISQINASMELAEKMYEKDTGIWTGSPYMKVSNYRVVEKGDFETSDLCALHFKIGSKMWPTGMIGMEGEACAEVTCDSTYLLANLSAMREDIKEMTEDSERGKDFLKTVIEVAERRAKFKFNEDTGRLDLDDPSLDK